MKQLFEVLMKTTNNCVFLLIVCGFRENPKQLSREPRVGAGHRPGGAIRTAPDWFGTSLPAVFVGPYVGKPGADGHIYLGVTVSR